MIELWLWASVVPQAQRHVLAWLYVLVINSVAGPKGLSEVSEGGAPV